MGQGFFLFIIIMKDMEVFLTGEVFQNILNFGKDCSKKKFFGIGSLNEKLISEKGVSQDKNIADLFFFGNEKSLKKTICFYLIIRSTSQAPSIPTLHYFLRINQIPLLLPLI